MRYNINFFETLCNNENKKHLFAQSQKGVEYDDSISEYFSSQSCRR